MSIADNCVKSWFGFVLIGCYGVIDALYIQKHSEAMSSRQYA